MSTDIQGSLVPWIQTLPSHWHVHRLGWIADVVFSNVDKHTLEGEVSVLLCNYTDVYKNDRITSGIEFMHATALPREIDKFQVRRGDVLATKDSENPYDIAISALVMEDLPGVLCGYHLAMIRPDHRKCCGPFLAWVQASKQIRAQYEAKAVGVTRFALDRSAVKEAYVPLPPLSEQHFIAAYLDEQTEKIDRLIVLRQRQMQLLREQRASLIQEAVTRGLNPSVSFKDTGATWLGEIPTHWKMIQLRRIIKSETSITYGIVQAGPHIEGGIPYIRTSDISGDSLPLEGYLCTTPEIDRSYQRSKVITGDVVVAIRATIGKALPVPPELDGANLTQGTAKISPGRRITTEFLLFALRCESASQQFASLAKGTTFLEITLDMLRRFSIPLPPLKEQEDIVSFINVETTKLDTLHSTYARQISLLQEYRASLIYECVTGQRPVGVEIASELELEGITS